MGSHEIAWVHMKLHGFTLKIYGSYRSLNEHIIAWMRVQFWMTNRKIIEGEVLCFLKISFSFMRISYINERASKDSETKSWTTKIRIAICIYIYLLYVHCIGYFVMLWKLVVKKMLFQK